VRLVWATAIQGPITRGATLLSCPTAPYLGHSSKGLRPSCGKLIGISELTIGKFNPITLDKSGMATANSATNVPVQTTWKAVEDKMMEKVMDEIKNVEKRLKKQFKKDTQLFVDGALLILMRNVEDMTVRR